MEKKYELTDEAIMICERVLHRIRALRDIDGGRVVAGALGGFVESEGNLCHDGNAWVSGDAGIENNCHYLTIGPLGSRNDFTTFFRSKDLKIGVTCGCFNGDIDAFFAKVAKTHGDNEHGKAYRLAAELAKLWIDLSEEENGNDDAR